MAVNHYSCLGCKYAVWYKTKTGRLSPSGDGRCNYEYILPKLPSSMYWMNGEPEPLGGYINRLVNIKKPCVYWEAE